MYFKMKCIPVIKAEFSASLLQSSVSHDPSEIILIYWLAAQETFFLLLMLKMVVLLNNNKCTFYFQDMMNKSKRLFYSDFFFFGKNIRIFCVIFDHLISWLNKSIFFYFNDPILQIILGRDRGLNEACTWYGYNECTVCYSTDRTFTECCSDPCSPIYKSTYVSDCSTQYTW